MQMRAIVVEGGTSPAEALTIAQADRPEPGAGELLVRVREPVHKWLKKHTGTSGLQVVGLDGEGKATEAYAQLLLAWGLG